MGTEVVFKPPFDIGKPADIPRLFDDTQQFLNKKTIATSVSNSNGGTETIYTVPAGKIFVLLSAYYSAAGDNASGLGIGELYSSQVGAENILTVVGVPTMPAGQIINVHDTISFGTGIAFNAGTTFKISNGSNPDHVGGVVGYEIPVVFK